MLKKTMITLIVFLLGGIGVTNAQDLDKAKEMYAYERYESAIKMLEPLAATSPFATYYKGLSLIGLGKKDKAMEVFQTQAEHSANMAGIARVLFLKGKKDEANSLLAQVVKKVSRKNKEPFIYAADAITYTYEGDPQKAVNWYKTYMKETEKRDADVLLKMGDAYRLIQGGGGNAMNAYEEAETLISGGSSLAAFKKGHLWFAAKNYEKAQQEYANASRLDPSNPLPYYELSQAYYKLDNYDKALENNEKYLKNSDNSVYDRQHYANTLYLAQRFDDAIVKFGELISQGHGEPYMQSVLAECYYEKEDYPTAVSKYETYFKKEKPSEITPRSYVYYGKTLMAAGRTEDALAQFESAMRMDTSKDKRLVYREIAEAYRSSDNDTTTAMWYTKIVDAMPDDVTYDDLWYAGTYNYYSGNNPKAIELFAKMQEKFPTESQGFYWMGAVQQMDDGGYTTGAAQESFKTYLSMITEADEDKDFLVSAYEYLAVLSFNQKDLVAAKEYAEKLLALDPTNANAQMVMKN